MRMYLLVTLSVHTISLFQLLLYLKEFSQKMSTKTHEIEKQVDTLVHEAKVSKAANGSHLCIHVSC